jgi:HEPN domain-containing protein
MDEPASVAQEQARRWMRWAAEDLVAARHSADDREVAPRVACSLAQQAAEKAIKALVVSSDLDPPKTHNLLRLARMLAEETADRLLDVDLEDLTRWAIEGRYPGDLDEATSRDAARAVELADQVLAIAQAALEAVDGGQ